MYWNYFALQCQVVSIQVNNLTGIASFARYNGLDIAKNKEFK